MIDKNILVVGMARSGVAVAKLLASGGAQVIINDMKTREELGDALNDLVQCKNITWRLGERAEDCLQGVDMLLISPGVRIDSPAVLKAQEQGIEVAGELEMALRMALGKLITITGTNGKTTTTTLVGEIMKNTGKTTKIVGNIGSPVSEIVQESRPDDVIVCEVSSFQLETVRDIHPDVSAILNISEDHLYRHYTMENYIALKARIFMNQGAGDTVILNYDDPVLRQMKPPKGVTRVYFSRLDIPPFGAFVEDGYIVHGTASEHRQIIKTSEIGIAGAHNLENALAATAIAMAVGVQPAVIRHSLRSFGGVEHRLEFIRTLDEVSYINDSKGTNVDSTLKAIDAMARPTVIILGGENKNTDFTRLGTSIMEYSLIKKAVLLGETENELAEMLDRCGFKDYVRAGYDFGKAIVLAREAAAPGWNVLLSPACKSFDMFDDYEQRGAEFKRIVNAL